jgi:hypothetical protein
VAVDEILGEEVFVRGERLGEVVKGEVYPEEVWGYLWFGV